MTFSKGKTWNLEDLRLVDVMDVSSPFPSFVPSLRATFLECDMLSSCIDI